MTKTSLQCYNSCATLIKDRMAATLHVPVIHFIAFSNPWVHQNISTLLSLQWKSSRRGQPLTTRVEEPNGDMTSSANKKSDVQNASKCLLTDSSPHHAKYRGGVCTIWKNLVWLFGLTLAVLHRVSLKGRESCRNSSHPKSRCAVCDFLLLRFFRYWQFFWFSELSIQSWMIESKGFQWHLFVKSRSNRFTTEASESLKLIIIDSMTMTHCKIISPVCLWDVDRVPCDVKSTRVP